MGTVTTTTTAMPLARPSTSYDDRGRDGALYQMVAATTANQYDLYRSLDNGSTWTLFSSVTGLTTLVEAGPIIIGRYTGWLLWLYRINSSNTDIVCIRRIRPAVSATWGPEIQIMAAPNGGVAGAVYQGMDMSLQEYEASQTCWHIIAVGTTIGAQVGISLWSGKTLTDGTFQASPSTLPSSGTRQYLYTGTGRITPSIDVEHDGSEKTSSAPHLWITFGNAEIRLVKLAWQWDWWSMPAYSTQIAVAGAVTATDYTPGRWDGSRFVIAARGAANTSTVVLYERDRGNTVTTVRTTPAHTNGIIRSHTINWNTTTGDVRVYAVGTTNATIYYVDFIRATGVWGTWAQVSADDLGANLHNWGVRRSTYGNARHDVYYTQTGTPLTVKTLQQAVNYSPYPPAWDLSAAAYINGGAADALATLALAWIFSDVDPAATQLGYALQRQVGSGAIEYWNATTKQWTDGEQQNTTSTTSVTLPVTGYLERFDTMPVGQAPTGWAAASGGSAAIISDRAHSGNKSVQLTTVGSPAAAWVRPPEYAVSAGTSYTGAVWVYTVAGTPTTAAVIDWYNSSHALLSSTGGTATATGAVWSLRTATGTAPVGAAYARFGPSIYNNPPAGTTIDFDDVQFATAAGGMPWGQPDDVAHTYKVKVWDSASVASAYSAPLTLIPSQAVNPTISAPTAAQVITTSQVTVTWSASEQTAFRVRLLTDPGGVATFDSTWISSTATTYVPGLVLDSGTGWTAEVTTRNTEGLASDAATVAFTVNTMAPPAATLAITPDSANGRVSVAVTNPAPAGAQPTFVNQDIWRREYLGSTTMNANPYVETNADDWTQVNSTVTRSTTQAHTGSASLRVVPNGSSADVYAESSKYAISATTRYRASAWVRADTANKAVVLHLRWYTSGDALVSASTQNITQPANTWVYRTLAADPPATAAKVAIAVGLTGTPAAGDAIYADEIILAPDDTRTGTRIGRQMVADPTVTDWYLLRSGVAYEYQAIVYGSTGTISVSPWTQ